MALRPRGKGWAAQAWLVCDSRTLRSGSYSRSGTVVTITSTGHNLIAGMKLFLAFTLSSGTTLAGGYYEVKTTPNVNTFTIESASGTGTGTFSCQLVVKSSFNVSLVTRLSSGLLSVAFETGFSNTLFSGVATGTKVMPVVGVAPTPTQVNICVSILPQSASSAYLSSVDTTANLVDCEYISAAFFGN